MKIFVLPVLFIIFFFGSSSLFSQEGYELKEIRFSGNKTFSSGTLMEQMEMYEVGWFRKNILRRDRFSFSEEVVNTDLIRLERFYQREGFLNVEINLSDKRADHEKQWIELTITINEGPPVVIGEVIPWVRSDIPEEINRIISESWQSLQLIPGKRFRDEGLEADKIRLLNTVENAGYAGARVSPELELQLQESTVNIQWRIDSGNRNVFGKVSLSGNVLVSDSLILRQLEFAEGDIYRKSLLDKTQRRIVSLGLFSAVNVKAIMADSLQPVIPVEIFVREAPRLTTRFGGGYGSEDRFRAFLNLQRLSFIKPTQHASLLLKYSGLEPYNANLNITRVQFLTPKTSLSINPFFRKETEPSYTAQRLGINIPLSHQLSRNLNSSLTYFFEKVDQEGDVPPSDATLEDETFYNKSGLTLGGIFDNARPVFNPARGLFILVNFKFDGLSTVADFPYYKVLLDIRRYQEMAEGFLALRLKLGGIKPDNPSDFVPPEERLYSGGSKSVRGWDRAELGPIEEDGDPLGGNSLLEGSMEIRFPLQGPFSGAVFSDFGNVWENSFTYRFNELKYSIGVGLRFDTPIGPVRLDLALPVNETGRSAKFHLDVGQAF